MQTSSSPAFPVPSGASATGISRRDYFAAMALQGVVGKGLEVIGDRVVSEQERYLMMAHRAYSLADAMIQASQAESAAAH